MNILRRDNLVPTVANLWRNRSMGQTLTCDVPPILGYDGRTAQLDWSRNTVFDSVDVARCVVRPTRQLCASRGSSLYAWMKEDELGWGSGYTHVCHAGKGIEDGIKLIACARILALLEKHARHRAHSRNPPNTLEQIMMSRVQSDTDCPAFNIYSP